MREGPLPPSAPLHPTIIHHPRSPSLTPTHPSTGHLPFNGDDYDSLVRNVLQCRYSTPNDVPSPIATSISAMLILPANDRASIAELASTPWIRDSGHMPPDVPSTPSVYLTFCGDCDDDGGGITSSSGFESTWGVALGTHCPTCKALLARPAVRRLLLLLTYGTLCAAALYSHMGDPVTETNYLAADRV